MTDKFIQYEVSADESSRENWYLSNRDRFIAGLALEFTRPGEKILDAGCGIGALAQQLAVKGRVVSGIDADPDSVKRARESGRISDAQVADICHLPFPDKCFDMVISSEVLEHVQDHVTALKELRRVSRGMILITVPAHPYLWTESDTILLHQRRYSRRDIYDLARNAGIQRPRLRAFCLLPALGVLFYKALLLLKGHSNRVIHNPLALRFQMPKPVNRILKSIFRMEMILARKGLIPWGHGWWMIIY